MKSPKIHHVLVYVYKYRKGKYSWVMGLRIHVTDAAISLRRASKTKDMWTKNTV